VAGRHGCGRYRAFSSSADREPAVSPVLRESQLAGSNRHRADHSPSQDLPPLRLSDLPEQFVTIDPGSAHCGVARWEVSDTSVDVVSGSAIMQVPQRVVRLVECYERSPRALYIELRSLKSDGVTLVIAEDFRLQKGRNAQGSRLVTPRVLGVIEYITEQEGVLYREQVPGIKTYIDPWLRAQVAPSRGGGISVESLASNSHKRDAIRHGLYPALRDKNDRATVRLILDEHDRGRGRPRGR
jgi:hypothetical protein